MPFLFELICFLFSYFLFRDLLSTSIVHRVMHEYLRNANEKGREELIDAVKEKLIKMVHTRDGARVAIYCLWYGTNKDRKLLIKSFKTFVVKIAKEEQGYPILWTIFDIVDDTKLVSKMILQVQSNSSSSEYFSISSFLGINVEFR